MSKTIKCRDCNGKGYRIVRNPACPQKRLRLPCFRCDGKKIDPGKDVVTEPQMPEDLDVVAKRTGIREL
jgi:hypothetical protein